MSEKLPKGVLRFLSLPLAILSLCSNSLAWNHPEVEWRTVETEHFRIQYHPGLERIALEASRIAEAIYGPISLLYDCRMDEPIYLNISDLEDDSQGASYFYMNRIDISASPYDFKFRGSSAWLPNVLAHELTHMISLRRTMKFPVWLPSGFAQAVDFEKEKRPDVITGYPNLMISLPVPGVVIPQWFAEGMAQYQCGSVRADIWDSHRDMLLRTAVLGDYLLTLDEMGVFGKDSRRSEMVYNQGFSMVRFIADRFGSEKLCALAAELSSLRSWGFDRACRKALGISQGELYRMWKEHLEERYRVVKVRIIEREVSGERFAGKGYMNLSPVPDRLGGIYYLSNSGRDYQGLDLIHRTAEGKERTIARDIGSRIDVTRDGSRICFSRTTRKNKGGYLLSDIFVFEVASKREKRLTESLRASNPTWSPDGKRIACVVTSSAAQRVAVVDVQTGEVSFLTAAVSGREYRALSWGDRGILASRFDGTSRDIVLIDALTGAEGVLLESPYDERDPRWIEDGSGFFYSSDRTGIFNIYFYNFTESAGSMVTNVLGGAFDAAEDGRDLAYSEYDVSGFTVRKLSDWRGRMADERLFEPDDDLSSARLAMAQREQFLQEKRIDSLSADSTARIGDKKFGIEYTKLFFYPRVLVYDGIFRFGAFLDASDYLDRQSVFGGLSYGTNGDFDFNLSIATRQFKPTFGFELYRMRKHYAYRDRVELDEPGKESSVDFEVRYDLWDAYFTTSMEFVPTSSFERNEAVLQYNHGEYGVNIELWELLEQREFRGEGGWKYYVADEASFLWNYRQIRRSVDADIAPRGGREISFELTKAWDMLHSGDFEFGFKPIFGMNSFWRLDLRYEEHMPLPWHQALSLAVRAATLDRSDLDDFFYLYIGSAEGLRGYSYYSLGGRSVAMARLTFRFPVWRGVDRQAAPLYLGSIYAGAFFEAGNAWVENSDASDLKRDLGFELRFKGFTFYSYPIAVKLEAAYGLDEVVYTKLFEFVTVYEGNDWKWYLNVLFGF